MITTLDFAPLEALGESRYDGTALAAGGRTVYRAVRVRRAARATSIGALVVVVGVGFALLASDPWDQAEPIHPGPGPDGWPTDAFPTSLLIGPAVPWEPGLDGQAFIETHAAGIPPGQAGIPLGGPDHAIDTTNRTGWGPDFTYAQSVAPGVDVVSATASLTVSESGDDVSYDLSMTNETDLPLVLAGGSLELIIELPESPGMENWTVESNLMGGEGFGIWATSLGRLETPSPEIGFSTDRPQSILLPGETLHYSGSLARDFPLFSLDPANGFEETPIEWAPLVTGWRDVAVISVVVVLLGPDEGILDDLQLVDHDVGTITVP